MKIKLKGGVKGLMLAHGEKAVFGVGVFCFLMFAYGVLGRETLPADKQPDRLRDEVQKAKNHVAVSVWDANREGLVVANYVERAKREDVTESVYALRPFNLRINELKHKRTDPRPLALLDLRTAAGLGAFALKSDKPAVKPAGPAAAAAAPPKKSRTRKPLLVDELEPAPAAAAEVQSVDPDMLPTGGVSGVSTDARIKRQSWAVITGLVPIKKQFAEFEQVFKDTVPIGEGKEADKSRDFPVYRKFQIERAEISEDTGGKPTWEVIDLRFTGKFFKQWAVIAPDVVGRDYTDPVFTMPLGPLLLFDWDAESVAHEPEIPLAAKEEREQNALAAQQVQAQNEDPVDEDLLFRAGADKNAPTTAGPRPEVKREEKRIVEYRLFRFFDFGVEPGKRYRYRVRLALNNPNYNLPDKYLKNIAAKKNELMETDWSAPSPDVTIPMGNEMMASTIVPIKPGGSREPTIKVKLVTIELDTGLPAVLEEDVVRGAVLNFVKTIEVANPITKKLEKHEVNFETNAVVLDIRGGRALPTKDKITEPAEVMVLDGDMNLDAHNELDDLDLYDEYPVPGSKPTTTGDVHRHKKDKDKDPNALLNGGSAAPIKPKPRRRRRG